MEVLESLPLPALFPVHPRTRAPGWRRPACCARLERRDGLQLLPPLGYLDFLELLRHSAAVLTDSGGVQKEAYLLEVPCITLRETTEWTETVELGWNRLVGLDREQVLAALADLQPPAAASRPLRRRPGRRGGRGGDRPLGRGPQPAEPGGPLTKLRRRGTRSGKPLRRRGGPRLRGPAPGARVRAGGQPRGGPGLRLAPGGGDPAPARATSRTCRATISQRRCRPAC